MNKRRITTRVVLDGAVCREYTQLRQIYIDDQGEYVNCDRKQYHIKNDSFDIVYTTGQAILVSELFKGTI